jgi:hypothetical protein
VFREFKACLEMLLIQAQPDGLDLPEIQVQQVRLRIQERLALQVSQAGRVTLEIQVQQDPKVSKDLRMDLQDLKVSKDLKV